MNKITKSVIVTFSEMKVAFETELLVPLGEVKLKVKSYHKVIQTIQKLWHHL